MQTSNEIPIKIQLLKKSIISKKHHFQFILNDCPKQQHIYTKYLYIKRGTCSLQTLTKTVLKTKKKYKKELIMTLPRPISKTSRLN